MKDPVRVTITGAAGHTGYALIVSESLPQEPC